MTSLIQQINDAALQGQISPLKQRVFLKLLQVPKGKVTTYGNLARSIGCNSARAIGQALKHNPFAPIVPCHRVIAADLTLHGFQGSRAEEPLNKKRQLLTKEGICFNENGQILKNFVFDLLEAPKN